MNMPRYIDRLEEIKYISSVVSDWLKHLEAKNSAFLVFLSGILTLVITLKGSEILLNNFWIAFCIVTIIASLILVYSFIPRIKPITGKEMSTYDPQSIVFFGEIAKVSMNQYSQHLMDTLCSDDKTEFSKYELMIISDIWNNSRITVIKSCSFKWALGVFFFGSLAIIILSVVSYLCGWM